MVVDLYNRLLVGKITAVDTVQSTCKVLISDIASEVDCYLGYPFVSANSGLRLMPKGGESVLVSFSPSGVPQIIGFRFTKEHIEAYKQNSENVYYRELKPGELVLYSGSGDTELYMANNRIEMGTGVSVISMDSVSRSVEFITGQVRNSLLSGVESNMGYLMRNIAGQEQKFPGMVEYRVGIDTATGRIAQLRMGNILDDLGIPELSTRGLTKTFSLQSYLGIVPTGEIFFDISGGVEITSLKDISLSAPIIYLGGVLSVFSLVRGETLVTIMTQLITQLNIALASLEPRSGQDAIVAGAISSLAGLVGQLPTMLSLNVRTP